jgi:ABC-type branched-subunit amino acid transport system ATPase component
MQIDLTLKNYRCFPVGRPARFCVRDGFTALIGTNNSGKSSLLKFLHECRPLFSLIANDRSTVHQAMSGARFAFGLSNVIDQTEVFSDLNDLDLTITFELSNDTEVTNAPDTVTLIEVTRSRADSNSTIKKMATTSKIMPVPATYNGFDGTIIRLNSDDSIAANMKGISDACGSLASTLYIGPFRNAINAGGSQNYFDIQIGQDFLRAWRLYKTGPNRQQNLAAIQVTDEIKRIFGFDRLEIDPTPDDQSLQVNIDGRPYKLPEIGSGMSQFFLVLATAAMRKPDFILIDEPELNLHPSLQIDFLNTLASYAKRGVLFATHSVGLARSIADRIYSASRLRQGESQIVDHAATPRLSEFLGELSFAGYQEFGFRRIMLVEGPTEVRAIQQMLRQYHKEHNVVLLSLGGSQLIHDGVDVQLEEVKRITPDACALIDSERAAPNDPLAKERQAFVAACARANIECKVLDRRALENYFTDRAVKQSRGTSNSALGPYDQLKQSPNGWAKPDNWRIAREMTKPELDATDLGQFLASI